MSKEIKVLVVDDSPFVCRLLSAYLQSSPDFQIAGNAFDGMTAVEMVKQLRPDVVTLDLEMPVMNGLEALEHIMHECPTPVVVVSGVSRESASAALKSIEAGAVDFILKYAPGADADADVLTQEIVSKVKAASQVRVIRSLRLRGIERTIPASVPVASLPGPILKPAEKPLANRFSLVPGGVVVIGASTGGPVAARRLLENLSADFPAAVLIVQHMPAMFTKVFAAQLDRFVPMKVKEAENGDNLEPGLALVAPGGRHMLITQDSRVLLSDGPEVEGHRPSIDVTMQSAAQVYGSRVKGVLLTGMGKDGCMGLVSIRAKGGRTFVQDAESCVISGMPQRAAEMGAADHIAPPQEIASLL